jgi:hypothetical protein
MPKRIAPSAVQAQELAALLQGHTAVKSGAEWRSTCVPLATERVLQDALDRAGRSATSTPPILPCLTACFRVWYPHL